MLVEVLLLKQNVHVHSKNMNSAKNRAEMDNAAVFTRKTFTPTSIVGSIQSPVSPVPCGPP